MSENNQVTIVAENLRMLLFWASVGVHLSRGGAYEEEVPHVLESYAEHIGFKLPYEPKFRGDEDQPQ
jgi:hypothetical protein